MHLRTAASRDVEISNDARRISLSSAKLSALHKRAQKRNEIAISRGGGDARGFNFERFSFGSRLIALRRPATRAVYYI